MGVGKMPQELISLLRSTFYSRKEAGNVGLTAVGQALTGQVLMSNGAGQASWSQDNTITLPAMSFNVVLGPSLSTLGPANSQKTATWAFDDTTGESVGTAFVYSGIAGGSSIDVDIYYAMESAVANDIIWTSNLIAVADGEDMNAAGLNVNSTVTVPGTAKLLDVTTLTHAVTYASGDLIRLCISRWADNINDTATGDAHFIAVRVRFN